jgi:hypothetical protein
MKNHTQPLFSFRVSESFVDTTTQYAKLTGVSRSEYARQAIEEKNRRIIEERIHMLSKQLSAQSLAVNESLDDTITDGLHG